MICFLNVVGVDTKRSEGVFGLTSAWRHCSDLSMLRWREMAVAHCYPKGCYFCWCLLPTWNVPSRERTCCLSFFLFRKDHLSSPPVPYEKLQKLLEAVLKRCADLSPPQSSKKHAVSHELCSLVGPSRIGMILLSMWMLFICSVPLPVTVGVSGVSFAPHALTR